MQKQQKAKRLLSLVIYRKLLPKKKKHINYAKEDPSFSTIRLQHRTNPTWYVYSYTPEKKIDSKI